jgi:hypothetical protein
MITTAILTDWIKHPESLNRDTLYQLRTAMERYPFFSSLRLLYLKNLYLLHDDTFGAELRKSAIYVADRRILFYLIEGERYKIAEQEHTGAPDTVTDEEPELDRTLSLIDHFLEEKPKDAEPKPAQPVNYATDYVAYLMQQEEQNPTPADATAPKSHSEELIDGFISDNHGEFKLTPESPDEQEAEPKGPNLDFMDEDEGLFYRDFSQNLHQTEAIFEGT